MARRILGGVDVDVTARRNRKVSLAPPFHLVGVGGVGHGPLLVRAERRPQAAGRYAHNLHMINGIASCATVVPAKFSRATSDREAPARLGAADRSRVVRAHAKVTTS